MKICFLTDSVFMHGGVARVVTTLANELSKSHEVNIICTRTDITKNYGFYNLNNEKVEVIYKRMNYSFVKKVRRKIIETISSYINIFDKDSMIRFNSEVLYPKDIQEEFIEFINKQEYDIVIGCHAYFTIFLGIIAPYLKSKTVGWQHNMFEAYFTVRGRYAYNKKELFKYTLNNLDGNIVLTKQDLELYNKYLSKNTFQIYNPVTIESSEVAKLNTRTIISVGRLDKSKGFDLLIKAFSSIAGRFDDVRLIIVGDGEERNELNKLIISLNLCGKVEITGFTNDVTSYYLSSCAYVCSSRWEGFPLTPVEAMKVGLPLISFDIPSAKELLGDNQYGILVRSGDVENLSNSIAKIIEDDSLKLHYSGRSIERSCDFLVDNILQEWERVMTTIVNK
ncbi:glycosyl transferase [Clostridium zeae]|uniref:Glycosyl transferase n=1 Tax=Clostridium zeae TaxID=2759022 RepID=A0ABQ1EH09_9CLOT|nr:glycosyltransferase family 4 protein [Clostridium zeae]GFZ33966.1 glycosyl transferase [Clostridium zeae]